MQTSDLGYKKLLTQLLIDMNESKNVIDETYLKLDRERSLLINKMFNIVNKIRSSTKKIGNNQCYICGDAPNYEKLESYKKLNTKQLNNLIYNTETYLNMTKDYTVSTTILNIAIVLFFTVVTNIYLCLLNRYIIQMIYNTVLLLRVYPMLHHAFIYRICKLHDRENMQGMLEAMRILFFNQIPKAVDQPVWSCKYANRLSWYIIDQIEN